MRVANRIIKATRSQAPARACTPISTTHARTRASTHARTHKHALTNAPAHTQKYIIFFAFRWQQLFCERASILRYTYIACLV